MMYQVKFEESVPTPRVPSSGARRKVGLWNVAFYWAGDRKAGKWREVPVLFSFEWTREYFRLWDGGRVMVFGCKGCPPARPPTEAEFRSVGL